MKIALYHNLPSGGARRAMVEMVKGLVARGHIVDEYCPETADLSFLPLEGYVERTVVLPFEPRGVSTKHLPLLTPYITSARLARDLSALATLGQQAAAQINQGAYDVVFSHDCQLTIVPDVLRFLELPSAHYCHAATSASLRAPGGGRTADDFAQKVKHLYYRPAHWAYPWLRYRRTQQNLQSARRVLTNSWFARSELHDAFGVTAQVCYLGVDLTRFRPLGLPREEYVLSVGAVHHYKGYRFLIQALARISEGQRPPLVIAANSTEPAELQTLQALAAELRVSVTVRRVADENELVDLYNRAAAFVYTPIREPWGLAAVEAMACGTPVIAVGEGGILESVVDGETGLLTERDAQAFAYALGNVLADPGLALKLGEGGARRVHERFTWTSTVARLETILSSAAQGQPVTREAVEP